MDTQARKRRSNPIRRLPKQGLELSEEEQRRLIQESGVLQKIDGIDAPPVVDSRNEEEEDDENPLAEEVFRATVLITPLSFLLLMMEILIHYQFGKRPSFETLANRMLSGVPILSIFVFYTNRYKETRRMQFLLFVASIAVGVRMIWLVNRGNWLVNMRQCPPLATAWVYTVVQLELGPAVLSLVIIGSWVWLAGMKIAF